MSHTTKLTDEEKQTVKFYDKTAQAWSEAHLEEGYWKRQMRKFNQYLPTGSILEIGSGGGRDAKELIELGYKYTGTDISAGLLDQARRNVPGRKFIKQSVYDLDFAEKFDGFWACAVLLHLPKRRVAEALNSIKSVLKPGAIGFISIKDGEGEKVIGDAAEGRFFAFWRKDEFTKVLEKSGFEIIDYIYDPHTPKDMWHCFFVKLG